MAETRVYIRTVLCDDPAVGLDLSDTFPTLPTQLVTPPEQVPVVLFEPEMTMWVDMEDGSRREAQSDAAVSAGLHRCWPGPTPPDPSPGWSVRHTAAGIDLVLGSSVWATGATSPDLGWLELAGAHQQVLALYGTRLGVRIPRKLESARYTPDLRRRELDDARRDGDVAYGVLRWYPLGAEPPDFALLDLREIGIPIPAFAFPLDELLGRPVDRTTSASSTLGNATPTSRCIRLTSWS